MYSNDFTDDVNEHEAQAWVLNFNNSRPEMFEYF